MISKRADPKICASIATPTLEEALHLAKLALGHACDLVELRLDHLRSFSPEQIRSLPRGILDRAIITLRPLWEGGLCSMVEEERVAQLEALVHCAPAFMDVELKTLKAFPHLTDRLKEAGVKIIASWHSFKSTPKYRELASLCEEALRAGQMAKLVPMAQAYEDNLEVLELYSSFPRERLVAFCMGEKGIPSRLLALLLGSPLAYASLDERPTAPGQLPASTLRRILDALLGRDRC